MKPREIAKPEPGYFRMRLTKGGPWVAARIARICHCTIGGGGENAPHDWTESCDRYPHLSAEIDGKPGGVDQVWTSGQPISRREYEYLRDDRAWCREYAPDLPEAKPREPADLKRMDPIF